MRKIPYTYFQSCHSHSNAIELERTFHHEKHYGMVLKSKNSNVYIETVEHAQAIIKALNEVIDERLLFTEAEIEKYESIACKTLDRMIKARNTELNNLITKLEFGYPFKEPGIGIKDIEAAENIMAEAASVLRRMTDG